MIDETRQLRWYLGLGLVFVALAPLLMVTLLVTDGGTAVPLFIAGPVNVVGVVFVVRSMVAGQRERSVRLLAIGSMIVIAGTALLFGMRALTA
ncbi:hypothetical protein [Actinoplanes friuliensis]|uniref:Uncharacterized protein n=1 Tax=Actinoplanes friuliensis DSM 7358 TaxID=1246995 RepID=U5VWK1_9ACTN|nr:hypothetical protein [Actinoplanes friuliensis]AGZ40075.1 hypothetical protein AFR_08930 [Actinoplanes friuliensis DSM 7358]